MYVRPSSLLGRSTLVGYDYFQLHWLRLSFARNALFGPFHYLPGWYPHQLLGAPFSANLQSFPWIPTRLILLLIDPDIAYQYGVAMAAALSALFAYLYARRAGLSEIGAMATGWTFACAGFFATRVQAGQLGLLETYPSLPLLLWLADRAISEDRAKYRARDLVLLAVASAAIALAGHPQLPAYSLAIVGLYIVVRARGLLRIKAVLSITMGLGMTLFAWWPMFVLTQRSTRLVLLGPTTNDIAMPYGRLPALIIPGWNGWGDGVAGSEQKPFSGYPNMAYFWDTASYIGLLPLAAILFLFVRALIKRRLPRWPWSFLTAMGIGAFIFALPGTDLVGRLIPGTLLRSPARLFYLFTFAAAIALGVFVDMVLRSHLMRPRVRVAVVAFCLVFQIWDLGGFSQVFIQTVPRTAAGAPFEQILSRAVKDARIAAEEPSGSYGNRFDEAGIFDSIFLTNTYRSVVTLTGKPDFNEERLDGSELSVAALQATGVRFVITSEERTDLKEVSETDEDYLYEVPSPRPRASFFSAGATEFLPRARILDEFASHPQTDRLLLPSDARTLLGDGGGAAAQGAITYSRPTSDEIRLETVSESSGFANVLESYDPGWRAEVDGKRAPVIIANGYSMAVPVASGRHEVRLRYQTPGRITGGILSLVSVCVLAALTLLLPKVGGRRAGSV